MALERAKRCDDGTMGYPEKKRRRMPLQEVVQELSNVGLTQPALSFVQEVEKRRRLTPSFPEMPEPGLKRDGHELMTYDVMKRRRIGNDQVPILKVPKDSTVANVQELSMRKDDLGSLLPFRSQWSGSLGSSTVQLLLSGACGLKQVTLDSHGIMFEVYDHGFMLTELPRGWQPIVNSSGRLARVAKVALDSKGTAYFLSDTGELLMMVSAVRYLERPCAAQDELKLEFVDKKCIPPYARGDMEDHFSPSTVDPSPSMEDATDEEDAMEWEEAPELLG